MSVFVNEAEMEKEAAQGVVARAMANSLRDFGVDLADDDKVIIALHRAGFSGKEIVELADDAVALAKQS